MKKTKKASERVRPGAPTLRRETIRFLSSGELGDMAGGYCGPSRSVGLADGGEVDYCGPGHSVC
jgi:hypothetical protein